MQLLRIFFTKTGPAAYISHLDLQRVMARALRKSGLPVWWSQGFNPHIYMTFALPLPLLHESLCESVDVKSESEEADFSHFVPPLSNALPQGITVTAIVSPQYKADAIAAAEYRMIYVAEKTEKIKEIAKKYNACQTAPVLRKTKRSEQEVDLKAVLPHIAVLEADADGGKMTAMQFSLPAGGQNHYSPALVAQFVEDAFPLPAEGARIIRQRVFCENGEIFR